jgi:tetratricopeptide (TPR) repeat protein
MGAGAGNSQTWAMTILTHQPDSLFDEGVALHQAGRLDEARACYEAVLSAAPTHFDALHMTGVIALQQGETQRAALLIQRAIGLNPAVALAYVNLAVALNALRRFDAAIESCERALALDPDSAEALSNRGNALLALNHRDAALASYDRVVALRPAYAEGHYNRANALRSLGRLEEAAAAYEQAVALRPDFLEAVVNLGAALDRLRRPREALAAFDAAVAAHPASAAAHSGRAKVLNELVRSEEGLASADRAIALSPNDAEAHNNRGVALHHLGRQHEAIASFELACALRPDYAEAYNNIGIALHDLRRPRDALPHFDRALALGDDFAVAHLNRASALLVLGELRAGFAEYRWRWRVPGADRPPSLACPSWEGEDLTDKHVLVHHEQGYGDSLQFIRYAPALVERGARVTVLAPAALVGLFRSLPGVEVTGEVKAGAAFDFQAPLMCLPRVLGTTLETVPAATPYLAADPAKTAHWAARLAAHGDGLRVGLVWAGGLRPNHPASHAIDRRRSVSLGRFAPLADVSGVRFFSLQKDEPAAQAAHPPAGMSLIDLTADLRDFGDTAALVANLDLVIAVDTAVAHLAGALGKPVWVLSRYAGCWRWLGDREDSPWYPTARVFHQRAPGDWDEVARRVAAALRERA